MATESQAIEKVDEKSPRTLSERMASKFAMDPAKFLNTIINTVFPKKDGRPIATNEQLAAFLAVCQEYDLNPFTREIWAFPTRGGGIAPIVSVDGWLKLINRHPAFDGMEISIIKDEKTGKPDVGTITIYRA
jgi:hypothetical protein